MNDIRVYLKYYSNYSFTEEPFNDVDNVIMSFLSYIDFDGVVPTIGNSNISLEDASKLYFDKHTANENDLNIIAVRKAISILKIAGTSKRYKDLLLYNYSYKCSEDGQFGAMCIKLDKNTVYVSYEGTDSSVSGWEEDFKMSYMFPTFSQKHAIDYLNTVITIWDKNIIVGGHSKGGNLALISSMFCKPRIRNRINLIYNNDGPGLRKKEYNSQEYKMISSKLKSFVPEQSLVGLLLRHDTNYNVVSSTAKGVLQHDATTWCCYGGHFINSRLSKNSKKFEISIQKWLDKYDNESREKFTKTLFDIFRKSGITDLKEFKTAKLKGIMKVLNSTKDIDQETKEMILDCLKSITSEEI